MKKVLLIIAILATYTCGMMAQTKTANEYKQQIKERKEMLKYSDKVLKSKIAKSAKAAVKQLKKEGWKPFPGEAPLENQFNEKMRLATLMDGILPKYLMGEGNAVSNIRQVATKSAEVSARSGIAAQFKVEIDEVIDQSLNGNQRNQDEDAMARIVSEETQHISQTLQYVMPIIKMYRERNDGKVEVNVTMYTETNQAKLALFEKMEAQNAALREKLEKAIENK